jgi:TetR/AcrR family transcriptional regulator
MRVKRTVGRNLNRTRERILAAALAEFSAKGLAGARVDEIARRARVNKRMLYYCFGNKQDLYREILRRKFGERAGFVDSIPPDLGGAILHIYRSGGDDIDFVRLMEWEAIDPGKGPLIAESERRALFEKTIAALRIVQRNGDLPENVNLSQLLISMIALAVFPLAMPQMIHLISGMKPTDARFRRERLEFLRWLGAHLSGFASSAARSPHPHRRRVIKLPLNRKRATAIAKRSLKRGRAR